LIHLQHAFIYHLAYIKWLGCNNWYCANLFFPDKTDVKEIGRLPVFVDHYY